MSFTNGGHGKVNIDEISNITKRINSIYSTDMTLHSVNPFPYHNQFVSMIPTAAVSSTSSLLSMQSSLRSCRPGSRNVPYSPFPAIGSTLSHRFLGDTEWRGFNVGVDIPKVDRNDAELDEYGMYQQMKIRSEQEEALQWNRMYDELVTFYIRFGHCIVPKNDGPLGQWVTKQRNLYSLYVSMGCPNATTLTPQRIVKLDVLNFEWDVSSAHWEEMFLRLQDYATIHGHCNVPIGGGYDSQNKANWKKNSDLRLWIKAQRRQRRLARRKKNSMITNARILKLDSIGFDWNADP